MPHVKRTVRRALGLTGAFYEAGPPAVAAAGDPDPVIVLVHGIGASARYFAPLQQQLALTHRVIAVTLPGFGNSPLPEEVPPAGEAADYLERTLREAGVDSAVVVGHSMGCQVVVELALRHPDLVRAVTLIGPVCDVRHRNLLGQAVMFGRDVFGERLGTVWVVLTDYLRCGLVWYLRVLPHMIDYPIEERLSGVRQPVLLIRGVEDTVANASWSRMLLGRTDRGVLLEYPGERHGVLRGPVVDLARRILDCAASPTALAASTP